MVSVPALVKIALSAAIFLIIGSTTPALAGMHWSNSSSGPCGADGIACAISDFQYYSEPYAYITGCFYDYNSDGHLIGAICGGRTPGGASRSGLARVDCDVGERRTSVGCTTEPPPDHDNFCPATVGNPVDVRSGMKIEKRLDFTTDGNSPLTFERFYWSDQSVIFGKFIPSRLGRGWRSNFDSSVSSYPTSDGWIAVMMPTGEIYYFTYSNSAGAYIQSYYDWNNFLPPGSKGRTASVDKNLTTQKFTLTTDDGTVWVYGFDGKLQSITSRDGYSQSLTYDSNGNNSVVTDSFGRTLNFEYSPQGLLTSMTVPGGQVYNYSYLGRYAFNPTLSPDIYTREAFALEYAIQPDSTPSDADNPRIRYHYENTSFPFALTGITNEASVRYATWSYGSNGRVATSEHAGGVENYSFSYNSTANTVTVTNPLSKNAIYHLARIAGKNTNQLTRIQGQASANCVASDSYFTYNANTFVTDVTDAEGRITHYVRDNRGNPTSITRAYGTLAAQTNTYTWHPTINVPTQSVEPGLTTDYTWTSGRLTQLTQADTTTHTIPYSTNGQTRTWSFTYTTGGLLASVDGPLSGSGDTATYTYNSSGFVATVTNEVSQVTTVTAWNGRGQPTSATDPNGIVWTLTYDDVGCLKTYTIDPSGSAALTSIDYSAPGDVTKITRPNGSYLQYTYDNARRLTKIEDNSGAYVEYNRDNLGNATARRVKDSGGTIVFPQTATFDELGRLLRFIGASGQTWTHAYDKTDNRISVTDPRSGVYGWTFDGLNRLVGTTDEDLNTETLIRNGKDEIANYADPRSLNTSYVRNGFGDVIQRTSPDTGTTIYTYNALSKPTQLVDGRGVTTNLTYDNAGRLLTKNYPAATAENITYTWDTTVGGNRGIGRITKIDDQSGSIEWTYNSLGQVTQEKKATSSVVYTVGYTYDLDGNVTQITYPSGRTVSYARGPTGLVTEVTTKKDPSSSSVTLAANVAYQPFGPLQSLIYGNGLILWKTFTQDSNPNTIIVEQGSNTVMNRGFGYWYDDFNISNVWDNLVAGRTDNYIYTPTTRLQNAFGDWGEQTYWQDGVGNRTGDIFNDGTTTTTKSLGYAYNNNLVGDVMQGSTTLRTFSYDGAGNIIADDRGGTVYNYRHNNRGRLDRLTVGSIVKADYTYDALERMAIRTTQNMVPASTTHYIYDRAGRLIAESSGAGAAQREYIWIDDLPLAIVADINTVTPQLWYMHPDHLNRPMKMTDASQTVVWDAWYAPYGEVRSITGTASNNLRFPGQYFLVESGLHYNWHRHYDPTLGRYIQPDPSREVLSTAAKRLSEGPLQSTEELSASARSNFSTPSASSFDRGVGMELPEFTDGASLYAYARSAPALFTDRLGLASASSSSSGGTQVCQANTCTLVGFGTVAGYNLCIYSCIGSGKQRHVNIRSLGRSFCPSWILDQ